jgi:hypothetical protein
MWSKWEKEESGWQKKVVEYGNKAFQRISFEEWGLKSIPPLSTRRKIDETSGKITINVLYPSTVMPKESINDVLRTLATKRQGLHRKRMMYSFIAMPLTAPAALIPVYVGLC